MRCGAPRGRVSSAVQGFRVSLYSTLAEAHPRGSSSLLIKAAAVTCVSRLTLLERCLDDPLPRLDGSFELEFGRLSPADADEYARLVPGATVTEVNKRLGAGDGGFSTRHRGRLVGVSWASSGEVAVPYLHGTLSLPRGHVMIDTAFVAPDMRRRQVSSRGCEYQLRCLLAAGYRWATTLVLPENAAGFGPPGKLGYLRAGTVYGIGVGARRRILVIRQGTPAPHARGGSHIQETTYQGPGRAAVERTG